MDMIHVREILNQYNKQFTSAIEAKRYMGESFPETVDDVMSHVRWMCQEAAKFSDDKVKKAMRWLGFVQGVLWAQRFRPISLLKKDNMPKEDAFDREHV